jgi:hypothetical protein
MHTNAALHVAADCRLVIVLQQYVTLTLYQQSAITQGVEDATKVRDVPCGIDLFGYDLHRHWA